MSPLRSPAASIVVSTARVAASTSNGEATRRSPCIISSRRSRVSRPLLNRNEEQDKEADARGGGRRGYGFAGQHRLFYSSRSIPGRLRTNSDGFPTCTVPHWER